MKSVNEVATKEFHGGAIKTQLTSKEDEPQLEYSIPIELEFHQT